MLGQGVCVILKRVVRERLGEGALSKDLKELRDGAKLVAGETIPGKSPEEGVPVCSRDCRKACGWCREGEGSLFANIKDCGLIQSEVRTTLIRGLCAVY